MAYNPRFNPDSVGIFKGYPEHADDGRGFVRLVIGIAAIVAILSAVSMLQKEDEIAQAKSDKVQLLER